MNGQLNQERENLIRSVSIFQKWKSQQVRQRSLSTGALVCIPCHMMCVCICGGQVEAKLLFFRLGGSVAGNLPSALSVCHEFDFILIL